MSEQIREYWEKRAGGSAGSPSATTKDVHLRRLEIVTIVQTLREIGITDNATVLDIGCGDGYSTLEVAKEFPGVRFTGIDYSNNMIKNALERLTSNEGLGDRVEFAVGDVLDLGRVCADTVYDVSITDRCLINLDSLEKQREAMSKIAEHTRGGGYYVAIENFIETHNKMNDARLKMGLPEIPVRWHNLFFKEAEFVDGLERFFDEINIKDFSSSYYFATRVVYSAMCKMRGEEPDYNHEIHRLAVDLPWVGQFSPIRMAVSRRKH